MPEAMVLEPEEWDDVAYIAERYLNTTSWVAHLPKDQRRYGPTDLEPIRRRRALALRIVKANQ